MNLAYYKKVTRLPDSKIFIITADESKKYENHGLYKVEQASYDEVWKYVVNNVKQGKVEYKRS